MNFEIAPKETEVELSWNEAMMYCFSVNIDGKTGWRLPSKDELHQIWKSTNDFAESNYYWSSTECEDDSYYMWCKFFEYDVFDDTDGDCAYSKDYDEYGGHRVRAVRTI